MRVDVFCEYPEEELAHAADLWPCTIHIACRTHAEFLAYRERLSRINRRVEASWWVVVPETYWTSAFTDPKILVEYARQLARIPPQRILLDLEAPLLAPRKLLSGLLRLRRGKRALARLVAAAERHHVSTAEYPLVPRRLLRAFGLSHPSPDTRIVMCYRSMLGVLTRASWRALAEDHSVGIGTLATGAFGTEPILSPVGLRKDLEEARNRGVPHVTVFRLGGITAEHRRVIDTYR